MDNKGNIIAGVEVCRDVTDRDYLAQEVRERSIELGKLNDQLLRKKSELEKRTQELETAYQELQRTHTQLLQQEKMASIGQLAAGIAHEINTPIQFVGDNLSFLSESFQELMVTMMQCRDKFGSANEDAIELSQFRLQIDSLFEELDFDYLEEEIPLALKQAGEGVRRVSEIVLAIKNFAKPGDTLLGPVVLDDLIRSTVEISRNAWNYVADLDIELASPPIIVKGQKSNLGHALLNLIINTSDAITDKPRLQDERGRIRILTRRKDNIAELIVEDSGCGIEPSLLKRIFEPFFTTKEVGRGSGQGLAIAYSIITKTHGGELLVESERGLGSTFIVRLLHKIKRESRCNLIFALVKTVNKDQPYKGLLVQGVVS